MSKTLSPPGKAGLYTYQEAQTYSSIKEADKLRQKWTFDKKEHARKEAYRLNEKLEKSHGKPFCIKGVAVGYCEKNTVTYKPVYCGKEHCDFCGKDRSPAHYRRINAVLPTVEKWAAVTTIVITIPESLRLNYYSKGSLNKFRNFIRRKLKADGFEQGALRWHWSGKCKGCLNKKGRVESCLLCSGTGCSDEFHPHLNILLPAGNNDKVKCFTPGRYDINKTYLEEWRKSLEKWFKKQHKDNKEIVVGNLWTSFVPPVGTAVKARDGKFRPLTQDRWMKKVRHNLRYIYRATLRNPILVNSFELILKKYINTSRIGQWDNPAPEPFLCHCCNEPVRWSVEIAAKFWDNYKTLTEIAPGVYYRDLDKDHTEEWQT